MNKKKELLVQIMWMLCKIFCSKLFRQIIWNKLHVIFPSVDTDFLCKLYRLSLIHIWHSSKYDGILQEINARMILYNFCALVTSHAVVKTSKNTN